MRRVFVSRHEYAPGVHTHGAQTPPEQVVEAPQATSEVPSPSALQTRRVVELRQVALPGVHTALTHDPAEQTSPAAHETATKRCPSTSQTCLAVLLAQVGPAAPGVHIRAVHRPAPKQA
jgi:hypothetical protein